MLIFHADPLSPVIPSLILMLSLPQHSLEYSPYGTLAPIKHSHSAKKWREGKEEQRKSMRKEEGDSCLFQRRCCHSLANLCPSCTYWLPLHVETPQSSPEALIVVVLAIVTGVKLYHHRPKSLAPIPSREPARFRLYRALTESFKRKRANYFHAPPSKAFGKSLGVKYPNSEKRLFSCQFQV